MHHTVLQADALLTRAHATDDQSTGQQTHAPGSCLNTGKRSLGATFRSITARSRGAAVSARSASGLTAQQDLSVSNRQLSTNSADDMDSTLAGSSDNSRSSSYSSQSGSSYSSRSSSPLPNKDTPVAQVHHAQEEEGRQEVTMFCNAAAACCWHHMTGLIHMGHFANL